MKKYKVIDYFQWGKLSLEKGQVITVEDHPDWENSSIVTIYGTNKTQPVSKKAEETMVYFKKIKEM